MADFSAFNKGPAVTTLEHMRKLTIERLARMNQRELQDIRRTVAKRIDRNRKETEDLKQSVRILEARVSSGLDTLSQALEALVAVLPVLNKHNGRRPNSPASREQSTHPL